MTFNHDFSLYSMDKETQDAFQTMGNLVTEGFNVIHNRLNSVDDKLNNMDTRLNNIDGRLHILETAVTKIKSDIHYMQNDIKTIPDLFNLVKEHEELHTSQQS